jgi:hypothetical protein
MARAPRDSDELLDLIADIAYRRGPLAAVARCRELLANPPSFIDRTSLLIQLGENCELAHDAEGAESAYREAAAGGDPEAGCFLAAWLVTNGHADEGRDLAASLIKNRDLTGDMYLTVGEALEEAGDWTLASRWFTAGLLRLEDTDDAFVDILAVGRLRVRQRQGLDLDEYDEWALSTRAERD